MQSSTNTFTFNPDLNFNLSAYLASHAEAFIDYIDKKAGNNINDLFKSEGGDRFLLEDETLKNVLKNHSLLSDFNKRFTAWKLIVEEEAVHLAREAFRTYYFKPIATHPKWQSFLAKHPDTPQSQLDQISGSFCYWIILEWLRLETNPDVIKRVQSLVKMLKGWTDAEICKEFEKELISELTSILDGFFLSIFNLGIKKEEVSERVKHQLIQLHSYASTYKNIKLHLWNRIQCFLATDMSLSIHTVTSNKDVPEKKEKSKSKLIFGETPALKNEIAKGLLKYFSEQTTNEERASDKYHVLLTNIFNLLYPFVSKEKHKEYEELFMFVPEDIKQPNRAKQKREHHGEQRQRPLSRSRSTNNLKDSKRSIVNAAPNTSANDVLSPTQSTPSLHTRDDSSIGVLHIPLIPEDGSEVVKLASPKRRPGGSTHYRRESFFTGPPAASTATNVETNQAMKTEESQSILRSSGNKK